MLMEYAAQIKGLTQHRVIRGLRRVRHVPREVCDAARLVKSEAIRILAIIRSEIEELASGRKAQKAKMEQIKNSHSFLQAATELLDQAEVETVQQAKRRRQSHQLHPPMQPTIEEESTTQNKQDAVNSLASFMSALHPSPSPSPSPSASPAPPASSPADAAKINELASLVAALSQQMAALKGVSPPPTSQPTVVAPGGAVASVGPSVPIAPPIAPPMAPPMNNAVKQNIPQAPPLTSTSFWFTGKQPSEFDDVDADEDGMVPLAPIRDPAAATSAAAPNARASILGEITNRVPGQLKSVASRSAQPQKERSQSVISTKPAVQCYTRRIPGSESMSLTDSIRVASRIKLRRTDQDRSPGGTPCKSQKSFTSSSTEDVLQAALKARFKNVHAMDAAAAKATRSQSVIVTNTTNATSFASPNKRTSNGRRSSIDKENWETS